MKISAFYTLFAILATATNIEVQDLSIRYYSGPYAIAISVGFGTIAGLLLKYILDKRYIFRFKAENPIHDTRAFLLYSMMGAVTTLIFWSFEFGFNHLYHTKESRYLGAVIGLAIGYVSKYQLDKRFVFKQEIAS
ncbi:MAG: GtrA family protein [Chlorobaculum sp.]